MRRSLLWVIWTLLCVLGWAPATSQAGAPVSAGDLKADAWVDPLTPLRLLPLAGEGDLAALAATWPRQADTAPAGLGDWTRVAFQSYRDGNWEIYLAGGDGSQPRRLTDHPEADVLPSLDASVSRIAFASQRRGSFDIFTMRTDGTELRGIAFSGDDETTPALSPNGALVAYTRAIDENPEIYLADADGAWARRITFDDASDVGPAWSPDGALLAWVSTRGDSGVIVVANFDGSEARAITPRLRYLENVTWSPDGRFFAFDYDADGDYWNELGIVGLDGSGLRTVYDPGAAFVDAWMGSWTGDGNWLAFSLVQYVVRDDRLYLGATWILRAPMAGGALAEVSVTGVDLSPSWVTLETIAPRSSMQPLPDMTRVSYSGPITLHMIGEDVGGSGIALFDVQVKPSFAADWQDVARGVPADGRGRATVAYPGAWVGIEYAFRVRARDHALNEEAWPAVADTRTWVYAMSVSGETRDARGVLLPNARVIYETDQAISGPFASQYRRGWFNLLFDSDNGRELEARQPGYTPSPRHYFPPGSDYAGYPFYLPGVSSLLSNGGFEAGTDGWQLGDVYSPTLAYPARSGWQSLQLGRRPGLNNAMTLNPYLFSWGEPAALALDAQRTAHILYRVSDSYKAGLYYRQRPANGQWSAPEEVASGWTTYELAVAPDGTVHALFGFDTDTVWQLYHIEKPANGSWSVPALIPGVQPIRGGQVKLLADDAGRLDLIYSCAECVTSLYHQVRTGAGTWSAPKPLTPEGLVGGYTFQAVRMASGAVHLFWDVMQMTLSAEGVWSAPRKLWGMPEMPGGRGPGLAADSAGGLVLLWISGDSIGACQLITLRSSDGGASWSQPALTAAHTCEAHFLIADGLGAVYAFAQGPSPNNTNGIAEYYRRSDDGGVTWSQPIWFVGDFPASGGAADPVGERLILVTSGSVGEMVVNLPSGVSAVSRTVQIPSGPLAPTLSFFYRAGQIGPGSADPLQVTVNGTAIWTGAAEQADWRHTWLDLSAFRGQTVTLAFRTTGAVGSSMSWALLDEVSLAAWQTPVAYEFAPRGSTLGLIGRNFVAGMSVQLNDDAPLPAVVLDSEHAQVNLAAALAPGTYIITTAAPDGRAGIAPAALRIGQQSYLPVMLVQ